MNRAVLIVRFVTVSVMLLAGASRGWSQSQPSLPVYLVTQTGAQPTQSAALATFFGIPTNMVALTNGQVSFIDPSNYLSIPVQPVTNAVVMSNLLAQTVNKYPSIPINFQQLDFGALSNLTAFPSNAAVNLSSTALANAGLTPQWGTPAVSHDILVAEYTNENNTVFYASNALDTEVDYQFADPTGHPIIGPGAQVQFNYGAGGNATRLLYATRQLTAGPMVAIISSTVASNRAAALYPNLNAQINVQLVYYAPPLSLPTVSAIIPWYLCSGTGMVIDPLSGAASPVNLTPTMIPATDNPNYVPTVSLNANLTGGGTQVSATASTSGGMPPYTYTWAGSAPGTATNTGPQIAYTPEIRLDSPKMDAIPQAPSAVLLSWFDPAQFFTLQSNSNLTGNGWTTVTNPVNDSSGQISVTLNAAPGNNRFFRLAQSSPVLPQAETLSLAISDANGVLVRTQQNFSATLATVMPINNVFITNAYGWGLESPWDPGIGTQDRLDWTAGVNIPLFGIQRLYYFDYAADSLDFQYCYDNTEGDYDSSVGTADILLYIGHGNPNGFSFTNPWHQNFLFYNYLNNAWGNHYGICDDATPLAAQEWMCLLSCEVLSNQPNPYVTQRWLPSFDGLHLLLGFDTDASAGTGFPKVFAKNMGGGGGPAVSIYQAWFNAAKSCQTGFAAALGPLGPNGVSDFGDYWWGEGKVGPTILPAQFTGWYYVYQSY